MGYARGRESLKGKRNEVAPVEVTKHILVQYCELREEVKDIRRRIDAGERRLERIEREGLVADTVKGTRKDGTIGPIRITGYPVPEYQAVKAMMKRRVEKLHIIEEELLEALQGVDAFIEAIPKSDLRMIFRLYYIDDLTWEFVAMQMNYAFPKRKIPYTKDSCRKRHNRYLEKIWEKDKEI